MNEWTKKRDLLVEETLAFVQGVATEPPKATDSPKPVVPSVPRPVAAEVPSPKSRLDMERAVIKKRVANFKDTQKKFQQEREEYYARTMADARATQWTPRSRDNDKSSAGHFKDGAKDRGVEPKAITELAVGPRTTLPPNSP
jgi:hypothetical protein